MATKQSSEAIVLHKRDYRNTSAIITMYTKEWGKQVFMARGTRRYSHRVSRVDYGYLGFVEYIPHRDNEVQLMTHFEVYDEFYPIRKSLTQVYLMAEVLRVVDSISLLGNPDETLFELLAQTLEVIAQDATPEILPWFLVSLLDKMGIQASIHSSNWMNQAITYMIGTSISRVATFKLSEEQNKKILSYVRELFKEGLHVDIDFKKISYRRPLEYLHAS